jgi:hypothetical protein
MEKYFEKVRNYLLELEYEITAENQEEGLFVVQNTDMGIVNMILDCEDLVLIMEQHLFNLQNPSVEVLKELLQMNRSIVHGALVLDETGGRVIFRDTLELRNLDLNELEASISSLSLFLSEYAGKILEISKK